MSGESNSEVWATSIDLVNTWCREEGLPEIETNTDLGLANALDNLWGKLSEVREQQRQEIHRLKLEKLEERIV